MKQKMITKAIEKLLEKYPLYSQEGNKDAKVLCKIFNPYGGGSWYILEAEKQENGDYLCFGLVDLHETELGYFLLSELLNVRVKVFGCRMPFERDKYFVKKTLRDAYKDCGKLDLWQKIYKVS